VLVLSPGSPVCIPAPSRTTSPSFSAERSTFRLLTNTPLALPVSRMARPWGPASTTACRREHLTSLRTRSHEGSRPRMAIVPSSSTSCPVPVGYWTWNFTRRDSSSIIQVLHGTHGEREPRWERPQGGFLPAEPGSTPGEAELEEEPPEDAEPRLGAPCRAARQAAFESMMTSQPEARGARLRELEGILGRTA